MNSAGGEKGNGMTLFAKGLLGCSGSAGGVKGAKRNAGGIIKECGGTGIRGIRTGMGGLVQLCVFVADEVLADH